MSGMTGSRAAVRLKVLATPREKTSSNSRSRLRIRTSCERSQIKDAGRGPKPKAKSLKPKARHFGLMRWHESPCVMASTHEQLVARSQGGDLDSFNQLVV